MKKVSAQEVGERIRAVRGKKTQTEFAKALGVKKQNYISRYERGRIPSPDLLVQIARMGRVSIDWLLTGKPGRAGAASPLKRVEAQEQHDRQRARGRASSSLGRSDRYEPDLARSLRLRTPSIVCGFFGPRNASDEPNVRFISTTQNSMKTSMNVGSVNSQNTVSCRI
jgi:transcriptional regulator with XRE-family HTH domain